jgi:hypothetical protein
MSDDKYILQGHEVVPADLMTWATWFNDMDNRRVDHTERYGVRVSTVFLGLDLRYGEPGPPLVFETMIFGGSEEGWQDRCSTWDEAVAMHQKACKIAFPTN